MPLAEVGFILHRYLLIVQIFKINIFCLNRKGNRNGGSNQGVDDLVNKLSFLKEAVVTLVGHEDSDCHKKHDWNDENWILKSKKDAHQDFLGENTNHGNDLDDSPSREEAFL